MLTASIFSSSTTSTFLSTSPPRRNAYFTRSASDRVVYRMAGPCPGVCRQLSCECVLRATAARSLAKRRPIARAATRALEFAHHRIAEPEPRFLTGSFAWRKKPVGKTHRRGEALRIGKGLGQEVAK